MFFRMIISGLLSLFEYFILGIISFVFSPFSWVFAIVVLFIILSIQRASKLRKDTSLSIIPSLMLFSLWFSIWFSEQEETVFVYSPNTAGFPIRNFAYVFPAMGSDHIPMRMWTGFYFNMLFWFLVAVAVWWIISHSAFKKNISENLILWLSTTSAICSIIGLGYLFLQFD